MVTVPPTRPTLSPTALTPAQADALMARAQAGDPDAFAALYRHYARDVTRYTRARLPDAEADDTASGVWERAWAGRHTYRPQATGGVRAWLLRIAANLTVDRWRAGPRAPAPFCTLDPGGATAASTERTERPAADLDAFLTRHGVAPAPDPAPAAAERLTLEPAVTAALATLTGPQRTVVRLRWFEDRSLQDTARRTGMHEAAVRQMQQRAFARLRVALAPFAPRPPRGRPS